MLILGCYQAWDTYTLKHPERNIPRTYLEVISIVREHLNTALSQPSHEPPPPLVTQLKLSQLHCTLRAHT